MAKKKNGNGTTKTVRIITLVILIAGLLVTFGATYGTLNMKINVVEKISNQADEKSVANEKTIISMQGDIKYIVKAVDELRGKR